MGKMSDLNIDLEELRAEFIDGPAADQMSFDQFLMRKGRKDLLDLGGGVKPKKFGKGGRVRGAGIAKRGVRKAKMR